MFTLIYFMSVQYCSLKWGSTLYPWVLNILSLMSDKHVILKACSSFYPLWMLNHLSLMSALRFTLRPDKPKFIYNLHLLIQLNLKSSVRFLFKPSHIFFWFAANFRHYCLGTTNVFHHTPLCIPSLKDFYDPFHCFKRSCFDGVMFPFN